MADPNQEFMDAYELHSDAIFKHCFFRLSDRERALEVTQETFTRAWDYLRKGNVIEKWKPFLYRVAGNLIIEEYRKRKTFSLDAFLEVETHDESMIDALHDDEAMERLTVSFDAELAKEALEKLAPQYREVVVLRFVDGLSPKEI